MNYLSATYHYSHAFAVNYYSQLRSAREIGHHMFCNTASVVTILTPLSFGDPDIIVPVASAVLVATLIHELIIPLFPRLRNLRILNF